VLGHAITASAGEDSRRSPFSRYFFVILPALNNSVTSITRHGITADLTNQFKCANNLNGAGV
jgi:hypothetical protein